MNKYIITTDNTTDLPASYFQEHNIEYMFLPVSLDGVTYDKENTIAIQDFYQKLRDGSMPTTSQVNPDGAKEFFREMLAKYDCDILHIAFSSGLSGTYNSVRLAAEELAEEGCAHKIIVVDSLCASLGEGLFVHKAVQNQKNGMSIEDNAIWLEGHKLNLAHVFTVDDLFHLHRGGRVSKTVAIVGSLINIKPILHVDDEGHLTSVGKVRGRKKSLMDLVDRMEKQMGSFRDQNDTVFISHGDCLDDANYVAELIKKRFGIQDILIDYIGTTIGSHAGCGTIAVFFLGETR